MKPTTAPGAGNGRLQPHWERLHSLQYRCPLDVEREERQTPEERAWLDDQMQMRFDQIFDLDLSPREDEQGTDLFTLGADRLGPDIA